MTRAAVVVTTVLLLLVSATPILFSLNDDSSISVDGADDNVVKINSLEDLLAIGNDTGSLGKDYVQTANIDFKDGDYNGGFNIDTKVEIKENTVDDTKYDIAISLHYSDTEQPSTTITTTQLAPISLNGTIQEISSGGMEATFTFPSDELPDTLEISAGGIASNIPDDAWTDANKKTDKKFAIACSLTGITTATEEREYTSNSNGNFTPIGSYSEPFTGTYDGGGFTINNLNTAVFSPSTETYSGMFGGISSTNVVLKGIGLTNNSSIVIVSSSSSHTFTYSGGLVGRIDAYSGGTVTIQNCYATGNITATASSSSPEAYTYSGGLAGYVKAQSNSTVTIQNCYTTGNITATASSSHPIYTYSGGLVGYISTNGIVTMQNCYTTGNITATTSSSAPSMPNAYAYSGGLVGRIDAYNGTVTIQNCYTVGKITADAGGASGVCANGGIAGYLYYGTSYIYNCYYLSEDEINNGLKIFGGKNSSAKVHVDGNPNGDGTSGRTEKPSGGRTLEELQKKETYYDEETIIPGSEPEEKVSGWSFYDPLNPDEECIWFIDEKIDENDTREPNERVNNGLPVLMAIEYKIFTHPKDVISNNVADNTFFVRSSIEGTYQWYYSVNNDPLTLEEEGSWILIPNATSDEYTTADDNGIDNFYNFYRCEIFITPYQTFVSNSAQLLMDDDINITINVDGKGIVSYNDDEITTSKTYTGPSDINVPMVFTTISDEHYFLESVTFNDKDITSEVKENNVFIIFPKTENDILNVTFKEIEYEISISDDIVNGNISLEDNITTITNSKTCEITITPDTGYVLENIWIVEDENNEDDVPKNAILTKVNDTKYKLSNVTDDCTINASFVLANYTIKVSDPIANGSVTSSMYTMTYNDTATITITPDANYILDKIWIVEDADKGEGVPKSGSLSPVENNSCTLSNVTGNCTITATFILANYTINVSDQIANGSLLLSKIQMTYEDVETITIIPDTGYVLENIWIVEDEDDEDGDPKTATLTKVNDTKYELSNVTNDCTITATFVLIDYTITLVQSDNGSVSLSMDTMTYEDVLEITIEPETGYELDTIDHGNNGTLTRINDTTYELSNVTDDCTITATFVLKNYNVSITQSDNGSVGSSTNTMTYEDTATITITPNDGYELESISCDNNGTLTPINDTTYELSNVTNDCTLTATFKVITIPDEEPIDEDDSENMETIVLMLYGVTALIAMLVAVISSINRP